MQMPMSRRPVFRPMLAAVAILALVSACRPGLSRGVSLPATPILSGPQGWVVILGSFVRIGTAPGRDAAGAGIAKRGELYRIVSSERPASGTPSNALWYRIASESVDGWIDSGEVLVFRLREQAETAREGMKR